MRIPFHCAMIAILPACGWMGRELAPADAAAERADAAVDGPAEALPDASTDDTTDSDVGSDDATLGDLDGGPDDDAAGDGSLDEAAVEPVGDAGAAGDAGDAGDAAAPGCPESPSPPAPSRSASDLLLRYDFTGVGSTVEDRVGSYDGQLRGGATLDCSGSLTLDGVDDFVDMPNRLVSSRPSVTVMAWITWRGDACWQRVFSFGSSDRGEGNPGQSVNALSFTTRSCPFGDLSGMYEAQFTDRAGVEPLSQRGAPTQVALVVDGSARTMRVYQEGRVAGTSGLSSRLAQLVDVDDWLGRSGWAVDPLFEGDFHEFRIYDRALSDREVAEAFTRGMDAP